MYTRVTEIKYKPEFKNEFMKTYNTDILPVLRTVVGLRDFFALESNTEPNTFVSLLFFNNRADHEAYNINIVPKLLDKIRPYLLEPVNVKTHDVYYSSAYKIASGKAA